LLTQLCKLKGARVIGTTSTLEKATLAKEAGADEIILYKEQDIKSVVMELTNGEGVDVVFDGVGKTTFDVSLSVIKKLGSMVSFGNASGKVTDIDIMKLVPRCVKLTRPSLFQLITCGNDFEPLAKELLSLVVEGKLKVNVSKVYEMENVQQAHLDLEGQKTTGKILLHCE
jgi:NADPH2:quinone reductase